MKLQHNPGIPRKTGRFRGKGGEVYHWFTTFAGRKNKIELKLIDGVPANMAVGAPFLF